MSNLPLTSVIADFTAGPPATPGLSSVSLNGAAPAVKTVVRSIHTQRGRQYELNKCEAGTLSLDVVDGSEWLNPANTGSPWNSGPNSLLPYRCVQAGMWWNASTKNTAGNLMNSGNLPPASTTPFDPSFESSIGWVGYLGTSPTMTQSTAQAFNGTHSLQAVFNTATDTLAWGLWTVPGQTYTLSMYVFVPASHTVTASLINFPGAVGSTIATATSSTTGAWQRLTMTGVPTGAVSAVKLTCTSAYPATVYLDAVQIELGSTASTFITTGPVWYPLYTGYVERYPQRWDNAGYRGLKPLECVDALSPLSRAVISQSYVQTILADGPSVLMPLNDDSGPQSLILPKGGQPAIGYTQLGSNSASVNFGGDSFLDGSKAVTVVQQNTQPSTVNDGAQITYIGTQQATISTSTSSASLESWIRFTSGVAYVGAGIMAPRESTVGEVIGAAHGLSFFTSGGQIRVYYHDPNGNDSAPTANIAFTTGPWNGYPDGKWHHLVAQMLPGSQLSVYVDGQLVRTQSPAGPWTSVVGFNNFFIESTTYFGDPISDISVANMALYTFNLSAAQIAGHYQRGIGYLGELPGNRALRLLTAYWSSNVVTNPGKTALSADFYYDPPGTAGQAPQAISVLQALEDIADTEMGLVWVDTAGKVHFDSRDTRYATQKTALYTFGENTAGGELPYLEVEYDYDPTYVYSDAQLTCDGTGNTLTSVNATSRTNYGQRILSKTMYAAGDWDVQQAANFYTQRYAKPAGGPGTGTGPRISRFTIDPGSNPSLVKPALDLDIGDRVTVKRRTAAGVTVSGDYYVEQVSHQLAADASSWTVDFQLSPVFVPTSWVLGDATYGVLGSTTICIY